MPRVTSTMRSLSHSTSGSRQGRSRKSGFPGRTSIWKRGASLTLGFVSRPGSPCPTMTWTLAVGGGGVERRARRATRGGSPSRPRLGDSTWPRRPTSPLAHSLPTASDRSSASPATCSGRGTRRSQACSPRSTRRPPARPATRSRCSRRSPAGAWRSWPPTTATSSGSPRRCPASRAPRRAELVRRPAGRAGRDRLLLARVRRQRGAAAVLRRPRRPRRRPPQGRQRPRRADRRRRPLLPQRLLPPAADGGRRAAREVRRARPGAAADDARARRRRRAVRSRCRCPARGCTPPSGSVDVGRVPLLPARHRRPRERAGRARRHRPPLRRRPRAPAAPGDPARHRRRSRRSPPRRRARRCSTSNEGHAGFLGIERMRLLVEEQGLDPSTRSQVVRARTVFTTHTPVPAGIDRFSRDLMARYFGRGGVPTGLPIERLLGLGAEAGGDPAVFNMAALGIRLAARVNGVSRLHGEVARAMFAAALPGLRGRRGADRRTSRTASTPRPGSGRSSRRSTAPARRRLRPADATAAGASAECSDDELVRGPRRAPARGSSTRCAGACARSAGRARPSATGSSRCSTACSTRTRSRIGFARRVPTYKRLTLMLRDPERLERLLLEPRAARAVLVRRQGAPRRRRGQGDDRGVRRVRRAARRAAPRDHLADYDMAIARVLVAGVDVWLNNPLRPFEACGTSGMKAALNGALNFSILDGWWDECYDGSNGWAIPSADGGSVDPVRRDDFEAERAVRPAGARDRERFYERDAAPRLAADGAPHRLGARARPARLADGARLRRHLYCRRPRPRRGADERAPARRSRTGS